MPMTTMRPLQASMSSQAWEKVPLMRLRRAPIAACSISMVRRALAVNEAVLSMVGSVWRSGSGDSNQGGIIHMDGAAPPASGGSNLLLCPFDVNCTKDQRDSEVCCVTAAHDVMPPALKRDCSVKLRRVKRRIQREINHKIYGCCGAGDDIAVAGCGSGTDCGGIRRAVR